MADLLTPAQHASYQERGLLVFDPQLPGAVLDGVVADLDRGWDRSPSRPGLLNAHRRRNCWKESANARHIATWPRVLAVLRELYGKEPQPFQTLNFLVGTEQPAHADTMHFNSDPSGYVCAVWVALEDMDPANGPLLYYPGSHRWPEPSMADLGLAPSKRHYARYTKIFAERLKDSPLKPELALPRRGEAVLWHGNLAHGGAARLDPMRTRLSQATHFVFAGCRFYTPMRSRGAQRFVRNPRPIRERETWRDRLAWGAGYLRPSFLASLVGYNLPHVIRDLLGRET